MDTLQKINNSFKQSFNKAATFEEALKTSDIDKEASDLIARLIPQELASYLNKDNYIVNGSVGKGLATKTPWIAIMDKEITNSTREGVYLVFLFSSDYRHVYLTLNQGTTVPGQFGPRLGKKEVSNNSQRIRDLLNINNSLLKTDGNADIADERYRLGAIYYTLWNPDDDQQCQNTLNLYLDVYKKYKKLTMNKNSFNKTIMPSTSHQRIFYGAPGTGKSHTIKKLTEGKNVIRTTFHPDSDYSTFVGAYKPTTKQVPVFSTYGEKAVAVKGADGQPITEDRIIYEFVDQAFLQAYTNAWKLYAQAVKEGKQPEEQYLIIEEINRGNCAQIFGDLFQLLDRDEEGFSEYPIKADKDMKKYLDSVFTNMVFLNAPALCGMNSEETAVKIRKGEILVLPSNLYIWATMNTSDQSLFPIDSAFKRRWDWEYVPIHNCNKDWRIAVNNDEYDWWDFLEKINEQIGNTTNSEDKKLGYFFCKADNDGIISAEKFVSKVIFYLWNDVFKDFGFDNNIFKDEDGEVLSFNKFYTTENGETKVVESKVELFLTNLGLQGTPIEQDISKDSDSGTWFKPKSVIFKITEYPTNPDELYERARKAWRMSDAHAKEIEYFYAYASPDKKIVACYKKTNMTTELDGNGKIRFAFEGENISDDPMIGKPVETIAQARGGVVFYPENINK